MEPGLDSLLQLELEMVTLSSYTSILGGVRLWVGVPCSRSAVDRLRVVSGRGSTRAKDAQGTPTQSHISPNKLVSEG